jgi:hypothetical protein
MGLARMRNVEQELNMATLTLMLDWARMSQNGLQTKDDTNHLS